MKILSAQQIREADAYTIKHKPINSIDLMERASYAFVEWYINKFGNNKRILIIAGSGNNGGDALTIARLLYEKRYQLKVYLAMPEKKGSSDYQTNLERLPSEVELLDNIETGFDCDIIIDGLFGSGLDRAIEGVLAQLIERVNNERKLVISIDIASGLNCDGLAIGSNIIKPTYTLSFQLPKLAFMLSNNSNYVGHWEIVDIGLDNEFIAQNETGYNYLTQSDLEDLINPRPKFGHKGVFGHALIVGGSYGKIGAIVLATSSCLRTGAGLVTTLLPSCGYQIVQTTIPEVMCMTSGEETLEPTIIKDINKFSSVGIGPGLGKSQGALQLLSYLIKEAKSPMVLDADALNLIAENPTLLNELPENSILTPHIGEFDRLVGKTINSHERLEKQKDFSIKNKLVIILKGANTSISDAKGNIWFNSTGNTGMATAGSGDVLTGMVAALLAQGYSSIHSAQLGVFLHGRAGDIAKETLGEASLIASDIVERISNAFISIN